MESIDTGTGYNDSVMINGSYSGNASNIKIRLINSENTVTNKYNGEISNGVIDNISLQPTKSGNYSLEIGIYNSDEFLEDHYINKNIFINLQLPDLAVMSPKILVTMENETTYDVQNVQEGDNFTIEGEIQNIGTVKSNNVTVLVNMSSLSTSIEAIFSYDGILPGQNKEWSFNITDSLISGEIQPQVSTYSTDTFEIDPGNNYTVKSLHVFPFNKDNPIPHEYNLVSENRNILEIQTNNEVNYEFSWLESYLIITNTNEQSWDFINLEPTLLEGWKFESEKILHLNDA